MQTASSFYNVDLKQNEQGKYAAITLLNAYGNVVSERECRVVSEADVFKAIRSGDSLNLNNCYLPKFSLAKYRAEEGLPDSQNIALKDFSAINSFFAGADTLDLSNSIFYSENEISFQDCVFGNGKVDFSKSQFNSPHISFENARFGKGEFRFQFVKIDAKQISFKSSDFGIGNKSFVNVQFNVPKVDFSNVFFGGGNVDFHYSKFSDGTVTFDKSNFEGGSFIFNRTELANCKLDFKRVNFGDGKVDFEEIEFESGKFNLRSSSFGHGDISFRLAALSKVDVSLDKAQLGAGSISFNQGVFRNLSLKNCQLNAYVDLRVSTARSMDLSETIVRDIVDLRPTKQSHVKLESFSMEGLRNLGIINVSWRSNNLHDLIYDQQNSLEAKTDQFRILKENFFRIGRYADEDQAYIHFKRCELKSDTKYYIEQNRLNAFWAWPSYWFQWLVFDKAGLYATSPMRVLYSTVISFVVFALIFILQTLVTGREYIINSVGATDNLSLVEKAFYHSAITYLTIGYGDYYPIHHARWLSALEGFVGVFMMSYFAVAFVRKMLR